MGERTRPEDAIAAACFLGQSHVAAVSGALKAHGAGKPWQGVMTARVVYLREAGSDRELVIRGPDGKERLQPRVLEQITSAARSHLPEFYFSMVGGNAHNVLGLMEHPRPFDFVLPEKPELPLLEEGREILSYGFVRRVLQCRIELYIRQMVLLREALGEHFFHVESPPPIGDTEHIRRNLGPFFSGSFPDNWPVAPGILRYKLWRAHSLIVKDACTENGINFLPVPPGTTDAAGFLLPAGYPADNSTHGNAWYGARVLDQAADLVRAAAGKGR